MKNPARLLLRVPVPWVFVLSYLAGVALEFAFPLRVHKESLVGVPAAGTVFFTLGAIIAGCSLWIFRRAKTTTVPGKLSTRLVTWGPYRFSRNPMYIGLTFAYLGEAGILKQVWPLILLPFTLVYLNLIVIPLEESRLTEVFHEEYEHYRSQVRRWI